MLPCAPHRSITLHTSMDACPCSQLEAEAGAEEEEEAEEADLGASSRKCFWVIAIGLVIPGHRSAQSFHVPFATRV